MDPSESVDLAEVLLRAGKSDEATALIEHLLNEPGYLTVHDLRENCRWEFARNDPQFAALTAPGANWNRARPGAT